MKKININDIRNYEDRIKGSYWVFYNDPPKGSMFDESRGGNGFVRYTLKMSISKGEQYIFIDKILHNSGKPRDFYYKVILFDGQSYIPLGHKRELIPALEQGIISYYKIEEGE